MDTQRQAFETEFKKTKFYENMQNSLENADCPFASVFEMRNGEYRSTYVNLSFEMWQAAKAQAVPEKDAVIKKLSDQLYEQEMKTSAARVLCETACELLDDYAHQDAMVILNDLEQAMKEPAND